MGEILQTEIEWPHYEKLLVGNDDKDDAAVYDIGNGMAVVSTTDFFMPIVDDAHVFGQIASVNAISDVYAMGAKPIMAIAILGWPKNDLPASLASKVIDGARSICKKAGIPLAGGHSIDNKEPLFGLAVTGLAPIKNVRKNSDAKAHAKLYLTKSLGVGVLTSAYKLGVIRKEDEELVIKEMLKLNQLGELLADKAYVQTMTDVTGFGLLGHLFELCEASGLSAEINYNAVPQFDQKIISFYKEKSCIPGGTIRNKEAYKDHINLLPEQVEELLYDPQTAGGLLIAVDTSSSQEFEAFCRSQNHQLQPIGQFTNQTDRPKIKVNY